MPAETRISPARAAPASSVLGHGLCQRCRGEAVFLVVHRPALKKTRNELWVSPGSVRPQMHLVLLTAKSRPTVVSTPRAGDNARVSAGGRVCTALGGSGELCQHRLSSAPAAEGSQMLLAPPQQHAVGGLPPFSPRWMCMTANSAQEKRGFVFFPTWTSPSESPRTAAFARACCKSTYRCFAGGACCLLGDAPAQTRDVTEVLEVFSLPPA